MVAELAARGHLTEKGLREQLRAKLAANIVPELRGYREKITARREGIEKRRADLAKPTVDRSDIVGELQRQEIRSMLRTLPPGERFAMITTETSGALAAAALGAPREVTGLSEDHFNRIAEVWSARVHGPEMERLTEIAEAVDLTGVMVEMTRRAMGEESGLRGKAAEVWLETGIEPADDLQAA